MKNIKCLILDDDKKIRDSLMEMILEFHPTWETHESSDGADGIKKLTIDANFDIVLTDYEMKPKNGLDVLEHIYNNQLDILSVMITSHANPVTFKGSLKFRVAGFIEKPVNATDLLSLLQKLEDEVILKKKNKELADIGKESAMILHDIKNPLTVIMGSSDLMKMKLTDEVALKFSQRISNSSNKILEIIDNVQEKIRNPHAVTPIAKKTNSKTNLKEIIPSLEEFIQYKKPNAQYSFNFIDTDVELKDVELYQIFTNLINNSLDAISDLPKEEQWIKIYLKEDSLKNVVLAVQDSGKGIPLEYQDKIFNPLFSNKKSEKGTGLGLSIIKDLLITHQGSIEYNSKSKNTEFLITLPKAN